MNESLGTGMKDRFIELEFSNNEKVALWAMAIRYSKVKWVINLLFYRLRQNKCIYEHSTNKFDYFISDALVVNSDKIRQFKFDGPRLPHNKYAKIKNKLIVKEIDFVGSDAPKIEKINNRIESLDKNQSKIKADSRRCVSDTLIKLDEKQPFSEGSLLNSLPNKIKAKSQSSSSYKKDNSFEKVDQDFARLKVGDGLVKFDVKPQVKHTLKLKKGNVKPLITFD